MTIAQSIKAKLANISRKQNVPFERILTSFLLERAVARLVMSPKLSKHLCFKGGFVSLRHYGSSRFTKDIDAAATEIAEHDVIDEIKNAMTNKIEDGVWFEFHNQEIIKGQAGY